MVSLNWTGSASFNRAMSLLQEEQQRWGRWGRQEGPLLSEKERMKQAPPLPTGHLGHGTPSSASPPERPT